MSPYKRKPYYCIRVGNQYVSGTFSHGTCTPKLTNNHNFAYAYDSYERAKDVMKYIQIANVTWNPVIEEI